MNTVASSGQFVRTANPWVLVVLIVLAAATPLAPTFMLGVSAILVAAVFRGAWKAATWLILAGLVFLSYGFNNIPAPLPGVRVPLVDVVLAYLVAGSFPYWKEMWRGRRTRRIIWLLVTLSGVGLVRLVVDVPRYGILAGRDALFLLETWGIVVGYGLVRAQGPRLVRRRLDLMYRLALVWFLLFPFRGALTELGPVVGIQRPTPLIVFTSAGFIGVVALFWFLEGRTRSTVVLTGLASLIVLFAQSRAMYVAFLVTALAIVLLHRRGRGRGLAKGRNLSVRATAAAAIAVGILLVFPPLLGRLALPVGATTAVEQLGTLIGRAGPGDGSFRQRLEAWPEVVRKVSATPGGPVVGVGFGPDLFGGFAVARGVLVRKPHNDFLEVWARMGLIGFLPWVLLLGTLVAAAAVNLCETGVVAIHWVVGSSFPGGWLIQATVGSLGGSGGLLTNRSGCAV